MTKYINARDNIKTLTKKCTKCFITKSKEEFPTRLLRKKMILRSRCKSCENLDAQLRLLKRKPTTKMCRKCLIIKPIEEFSLRNKTRPYTRTNCKDCVNEYTKTRLVNNPELVVLRRERSKKINRLNRYCEEFYKEIDMLNEFEKEINSRTWDFMSKEFLKV